MFTANSKENIMPTPPATMSKPLLLPVDILGGPLAGTYAQIHPVLVLGMIYMSFQNIVADPVNSLLRLAPIVALLQLVYCVICLPISGARGSSNIAKPTQPQRRKPGAGNVSKVHGQPVTARIIVSHVTR